MENFETNKWNFIIKEGTVMIRETVSEVEEVGIRIAFETLKCKNLPTEIYHVNEL